MGTVKHWIEDRIKPDEVQKYMDGNKTFISEELIWEKIKKSEKPDPKKVGEILDKALSIQALSLDELACLLLVDDEDTWEKMRQVGSAIKKKVYDNRIVTFAPLYLGNRCVNNCHYCGLRSQNDRMARRILTLDEIEQEIKILAGQIGHKRLIVVYGEHPETGIDYMVSSIKKIYSVRVPVKKSYGSIRRINVNAAPLPIAELKILKDAGLGTYQVFQETYHLKTYASVHPHPTLKSDYKWRLTAMHRAFDAGIDDVGIGVLFGLYDWRFEVMGLLAHAHELEEKFGIGPHTVSFPRLEPAANTPFTQNAKYAVSDSDFKKIITLIRLAIPYAGMILTARENASMRRELLPLGCTQTDASTRIGVGSYNEYDHGQKEDRQQFTLGDTRSLDEVVAELARMGYITSFCTAGYRCSRTGKCIMDLLRSGAEGKFCKLNAVLTFREWLDDFASPATSRLGEEIIAKEMSEIKEKFPEPTYQAFSAYYQRIKNGERDLYF